MAQDYVMLKGETANGVIAINKSVFQSIAEISIDDVENAIRLKEAAFSKPVSVKIEDNKLNVAADIKVKYGASVAATCELVQNKIYENIDKHLTDEAQLLGLENNATSTYASMGTKGDTANIWNGRSYYLLTSQGVGNNYMTFRIEADTTFYRDDRFLLHFVSHFVYSDGPRDAVVSLSVVYNNDSVGSMVSHLITDGDFTTMIRSTDRPIKAVEGFIYLNTKWSDRPRLLFVTNPSLIHFHETKEDREEIRRLDSIRKASKHLMIDTLKADTAERTPLKTNGQLLLRKKPIPHRTFRKEPLL